MRAALLEERAKGTLGQCVRHHLTYRCFWLWTYTNDLLLSAVVAALPALIYLYEYAICDSYLITVISHHKCLLSAARRNCHS